MLDGGLATELEAAGCDVSSARWSARLLREDPDAVIAAHRRFFDAGARVATTASCQASAQGCAARLVGGCCRVGPDEVRALAAALAGIGA